MPKYIIEWERVWSGSSEVYADDMNDAIRRVLRLPDLQDVHKKENLVTGYREAKS